MKKIINNPGQVVSELLEGVAIANPDVVYHPGFEVISRRKKAAKVGIVSGGGSGHEPSFAGYVGTGMLDAAVAGNVFASPSPDRILKAVQEADNGRGVLLLIMNYSGDVMNFEMAKDLAEAEGISVEMVVVKDDVSTEDDSFSAGRRGIAGTILVHKAAGAKALLDRIFADKDYSGREVAVLINGLGATPLMEQLILVREVDALLREKQAQVHRYFVGEYMTSLEMSGVSVSLMELDEERKALIDAPCDTMALKIGR